MQQLSKRHGALSSCGSFSGGRRWQRTGWQHLGASSGTISWALWAGGPRDAANPNCLNLIQDSESQAAPAFRRTTHSQQTGCLGRDSRHRLWGCCFLLQIPEPVSRKDTQVLVDTAATFYIKPKSRENCSTTWQGLSLSREVLSPRVSCNNSSGEEGRLANQKASGSAARHWRASGPVTSQTAVLDLLRDSVTHNKQSQVHNNVGVVSSSFLL